MFERQAGNQITCLPCADLGSFFEAPHNTYGDLGLTQKGEMKLSMKGETFPVELDLTMENAAVLKPERTVIEGSWNRRQFQRDHLGTAQGLF